MGETDKEPRAKPEETRSEAEFPKVRRAYAAPEVTVLELESVIKGPTGLRGDQLNTRFGPG